MSLSRPFDQWILAAIVVLAGLADQLRMVQLGPITGLAALTLAECGVVWCCWIREPWAPAHDGGILCMLLFGVWALGTLFWAPATLQDLQTLAVFLLFLGLLLVSVREGRRDPQLPRMLGRALDWMSGIVAAICLLRVLYGGGEEDGPTSSRSVAIVMLIGLCYQLAAWQRGRRGERGERGRLLAAAGMVALIIASLSRTASAVAIMLFPLAIVLGGKRSLSAVRIVQIALIAGALVGSLFVYEPIYDRIFGSGSPTDISSEGVNSSGRVEMWGDIFESFQKHMWLGQGVGSTSPYTDRPGMYHPHNDYLLLAHDYGLLGMGLFLLSLGSIAVRLGRCLRRARAGASHDAGDTLCLAGLLSVIALLLTMATDNSINYAFVMAPIGILLGTGIAHSARIGVVGVRAAVGASPSAMEGRICGS